MTQRRAITFFAGLAFSGLFLWIATRNVKLAGMWEALSGVGFVNFMMLAAGMSVFYWIRSYRWVILLSPITRVHTASLFGPVMIGYGTNFILPFQLGEVARTIAAKKRTGLAFMPIAFSIVVERVFDFAVILGALAIALSAHTALPDYVSQLGVGTGIAVLILIGLIVLLTLKTEAVLKVVGRVSSFLPTRVQKTVIHQLRTGASGFQPIRHGRVLFLAAATSLLQWSIIVFCVGISLTAVSLQLPVATMLLIVAFIVLGGTVPNAPGFIGSIQAGYVVALELTGGDVTRGIAASIIYHVVYAATAITFGLVSLQRAHLDLKTVVVKPEPGRS